MSGNLEQANSYSLAFFTILKGVAMGMGDSIPGVSGGTIAVIAGIYERLIAAITCVDLIALKLFFTGQFSAFWRHIDGTFLLQLALGILLGLILSASTVLYLLEYHIEPLMGFFIGLVLASTWFLQSQANWSKGLSFLNLAIGFLLVTVVGLMPAQALGSGYLAIYLSGAVAICAMILPGLSGAFILLILGVYEFVLNALINVQLEIIAVFVLGCATGLVGFSRILSWLLQRYHELSYSFIVGLLLGSVSILWPWQKVQEAYIDSDGETHVLTQARMSPLTYFESTGSDPKLILTILCFSLGILLVFGVHYYSNKPDKAAI